LYTLMGKAVINICVCRQCRTEFMLTIRADDNSSICTFTTGKSVLIDGASVTITIILCLHVLIAHRVFINLGYIDYFQ